MAAPPADELAVAVKILRQEIAALEHELRRVRDDLERNPTHALENRARQLRENIALCQRELEDKLAQTLRTRPDPG